MASVELNELKTHADGLAPNGRLNSGVVLLLSIHAILLLVTSVVTSLTLSDSGQPGEPIFACVLTGMAGAQTMIVGAIAGSFSIPVLARLRWSYRILAIQFLLIIVPLSFATHEYPLPWCILAMQFCIYIPPFVLFSCIQYFFRAGLTYPSIPARLLKSHSSIRDLMLLTSLIAFMVASITWFRAPIPAGFLAGIIYYILVIGTAMIGSPIAAVVPFTLIGFFSKGREPFVYSVIAWPIVVAIIMISWNVIFLVNGGREIFNWICFSFALTTVLSTVSIRAIGIRVALFPK